MARIPLADVTTASAAERDLYELFPSNLVRALLRGTVSITEAYLQLGHSFASSPLSPAIRELVILRVAVLCNSAYEWMHHVQRAESAGLSPREIEGVRSGEFGELAEDRIAVLRFVDELVATPRATETFDDALRVLGEQDVVIVTMMIGHYLMTARLLETLAVELDDDLPAWGDE